MNYFAAWFRRPFLLRETAACFALAGLYLFAMYGIFRLVIWITSLRHTDCDAFVCYWPV